MALQTFSFLWTFDRYDFIEWEATAYYIINAIGCHIALSSKLPVIWKDGVEIEESIRTRDNWDNQDA